MPTVSDASPLIALSAIGRLELLPTLFGAITVPPAVLAEIAPSISDRPDWFVVQPLAHPEPARIKSSGLGRGEREALSLSLELHAERVILDDRPARPARAGARSACHRDAGDSFGRETAGITRAR